MRICHADKLGEPMEVPEAPDALRYEYDEGGCIQTGPDFGCVHHEDTGR